MSAHFEVHTEIDSPAGDSQTLRARRLWGAVLLQAVRDYDMVQRGKVPSPGGAYGFNEYRLLRWFESRDTSVRSFEWICFMLDLNPASIRKCLATNSHLAQGVRK
jgi:hypothetical protein